MREMLRSKTISISINLTPVLASYFIYRTAKEIGMAIASKAICEHMEEIKDFYHKDNKDVEE